MSFSPSARTPTPAQQNRHRFMQWRLMALAGNSALAILDRIGDHNRKREFI